MHTYTISSIMQTSLRDEELQEFSEQLVKETPKDVFLSILYQPDSGEMASKLSIQAESAPAAL